MQFSGKEGRGSFELSRNFWTLRLLNRFVEQLHLHAICTFLFQKSAYMDCSWYALPKYLGVIQGNDLDCCRWVVDPWEVLEVSGSSLITAHYSVEGKDVLSTVSFGALAGHLSQHLLTRAGWTAVGVLCLNLLLLHFAAEISGSKAALLWSLSVFSAMISLWLQTSVTWPVCFNKDNFYYLSEKSGCACMLYLLHTHFQALVMP